MVDEHFPKVRDYFHETAEEYVTRRRKETGGFKWTTWRLNIKFLHHLAVFEMKQIATQGYYFTFTNKDAYDIFKEHCHGGEELDNWDEMNARNTLCAAAYRGVLIRVDDGEYYFNDLNGWNYCFGLHKHDRKYLPVTHQEFLDGIEKGIFNDPR